MQPPAPPAAKAASRFACRRSPQLCRRTLSATSPLPAQSPGNTLDSGRGRVAASAHFAAMNTLRKLLLPVLLSFPVLIGAAAIATPAAAVGSADVKALFK